jgi:hypothetical protein
MHQADLTLPVEQYKSELKEDILALSQDPTKERELVAKWATWPERVLHSSYDRYHSILTKIIGVVILPPNFPGLNLQMIKPELCQGTELHEEEEDFWTYPVEFLVTLTYATYALNAGRLHPDHKIFHQLMDDDGCCYMDTYLAYVLSNNLLR